MDKPQEISDYRILGYTDKDKAELVDRAKASKIKIKGSPKTPLDIWFDKQLKTGSF